MTLNRYGDGNFSPTERFGVDISSQRLDELDRRCLAYVLTKDGRTTVGIDLGCGMGTPSIAFSLAGADMTLLDNYDFEYRFSQLRSSVPLPRLNFLQRDLHELRHDDVPANLAFAYSQRTLHYLRYRDARRVVRMVAEHIEPKGHVFLSFSGIRSELGEGYPGANAPIEHRFSELAPNKAAKHRIFEPVCLYDLNDVTRLADDTALQVNDIWPSPFGNIKAVLSKPL